MADGCDSIETPNTLKKALDCFAALKDNVNLLQRVVSILEEKAKVYFKVSDNHSENSIATNFQNVLDNASNLQKLILERRTDQYGEYSTLQSHFNTCKNECIDRLISCLPRLHATLYYLRFNVDSTFASYGGGKWANVACNGGDLSQWLQGGTGTASARSSQDRLLPGGCDTKELRSATGRELVDPLQSLVGYSSAGALQLLLSYLLFSVPGWYHSDTATAVAFVGAFCKEVAADSSLFRGKVAYYPRLAGVCKILTPNLNHISGLPDRAAMLVAMCQKSVEKYKSMLKVEAFDYYVSALKTKLSSVAHNLEGMAYRSKYWKATDLVVAKHAGPFPYGFMFGEAWKRDQWYNAGKKLHDAIKKLWEKSSGEGGSLQDLIETLNPISAPSGPGSDGPRKPGSSGTLSASPPIARSSSISISAQPSTTTSEVSAPTTSSQNGDIAANSVDQTSQGTVKGQSETSHMVSEASVSGDSTITIGGAAGGAALLGGGCAALYFLNVDGIKTLITGVP
ncbi:secreted antigen 1 [Babesia caballi]|uniref:Secreted antigen 1 n=1 Tax=Babesia caballi TaxID=5871 RepID=A0AAV4LLQ5_BABCB|nr:secreted antigen 1 [Babesia caballi]